jgi:hypothetical protein
MKHIIIFTAIILPSLFTSYVNAVDELQQSNQESYERNIKEYELLRIELDSLRLRLDSLKIEQNEELERILLENSEIN